MAFGRKPQRQAKSSTDNGRYFFVLDKINELPGGQSDGSGKDSIHPHIIIGEQVSE